MSDAIYNYSIWQQWQGFKYKNPKIDEHADKYFRKTFRLIY